MREPLPQTTANRPTGDNALLTKEHNMSSQSSATAPRPVRLRPTFIRLARTAVAGRPLASALTRAEAKGGPA
jgi:hypothetical protein